MLAKRRAESGTSGESLYLRRRVLEKLGGYRAGEIRDGHGSMLGGLVRAEGGEAPRGINSRPGFDRRGGDWRCRRTPLPAAAWGGEERSERAGWGRRTRVSWWRRQEAEGEEPRRGVEGGGHHCSPRRAQCRRRRLGGWGVGGAARTGGLCAGRRAAVLSPPLPVERLGQPGRPRLPPDAWPTAAAAAATPRPCREGERRGGLPGRRGEQVRARAAEAGGREGGRRVRRESLAVPSATASLRAPARRLCCLLRG